MMLNLKVNPPKAYVLNVDFAAQKQSKKHILVHLRNRIPRSKSTFSRMLDIISAVASLISLLESTRQVVKSLYAKQNVQNSDLVKDAVSSLDREIKIFLRVLQTLEQDLKDPYLRSLWYPSGQEHQQYLRESISECKSELQRIQRGLDEVLRFPLFDRMDAHGRCSKIKSFSEEVAAQRQIMGLTLNRIIMHSVLASSKNDMHIISRLDRLTTIYQRLRSSQMLDDPLLLGTEGSGPGDDRRLDSSGALDGMNFFQLSQPAIEHAIIRISKRDYEPSRTILKDLLTQSEAHCDRNSRQIRLVIGEFLAKSFLKEGRWDAAEEILEKLVGTDENLIRSGEGSWEVFHSLAEMLFRNKEVVKAECWCKRAIKISNARDQPIFNYTSTLLHVEILEKRGEKDKARFMKTTLHNISFHDYVFRGDQDEVKDLLGSGIVSRTMRDTALVTAVRQGHEKIVKLLLDAEAHSTTKGPGGQPVLIDAAKKGFTGIVKLLLERGAEVEAINHSTKTALMLAAENGHEAVVQTLLENGADIKTKNRYGHTALTLAKRSKKVSIVRLLKRQNGKPCRKTLWISG